MTELSDAYLSRFGGIARLYGADTLKHLQAAHMVVIGLGGVGSWAAEALTRTGIGTLTLIELDDICTTNTNRQIHALNSNVGQQKIHALSLRLQDINPELKLNCISDFLTLKNITELITTDQHVVLDAIDSTHIKAGLGAYCRRMKQRLIMAGSSGGKRDPSRVLAADLSKTSADPMLAKVRNLLHRDYNFARNQNRKYRIDAVYSDEQMVYPQADGTTCTNKQDIHEGIKLDCTSGFGSATMVTGSFGFVMAARAIERYLQDCNTRSTQA